MTAAYAAAIAVELDRVRIAIARGTPARLPTLAADFGISPSSVPPFGNLRNLAPNRSVSRTAVDEVFIYQPRDATAAALDDLARAGLLALTEPDVMPTPRGVQAIDRIYVGITELLATMWDGVEADFSGLLEITQKALEAAAATGGLAFSVMAPLYEPTGLDIRTRFAETLTPLRFHRFDSHIAAWRAAGLTLDEVQVLDEGPCKDAIEADTNVRAALAYAPLTDAEGQQLLGFLKSLPSGPK